MAASLTAKQLNELAAFYILEAEDQEQAQMEARVKARMKK